MNHRRHFLGTEESLVERTELTSPGPPEDGDQAQRQPPSTRGQVPVRNQEPLASATPSGSNFQDRWIRSRHGRHPLGQSISNEHGEAASGGSQENPKPFPSRSNQKQVY